MSAETDFAWAVGLFEGESHFTLTRAKKKQGRLYLRMGLDMTDRDVVEKFARVVGVGTLGGAYPCPGKRKEKWRWSATGTVARGLVERPGFKEMLGVRRRARLEEILLQVDGQSPLKPRNWDKTHCKHGHPFDEQNTYITPKGSRACRSCNHIRYQRWKERQVPRPEERDKLLFDLLAEL